MRLVKLSMQLPSPANDKTPDWLGADTSLRSRANDADLPVPIAASGGLLGSLQKRMGFPSFKGNYTPAQFKAPAYGGDAALKNEVSKADAYRFRAKLPPINYDGIWEPRALLQGSAIDKSIGFVPTTGTKNPVFLGEKDPKDAMTGLTPKAMEAELFMSDKNIDSAMRTGQYAPNLLEAMMGEDANNMKDKRPIARQWGALARSQGVEPAYANLQQVLKNNLAQSISGGHPTDSLQGLDEVLAHEMGHTWLNNPRVSRLAGIDLLRGTLPNKDEPFEVTEHRADIAGDALSRMIEQSGWGEYHPLRSLVGHDADLPELLNYGSALQQHMFKTRGSRLETPEAVEGWMNSLMSQPDERSFEEQLKTYPFDVRRMMRHNWRLQQGSGNEAKQQMLDSLKERMKLWFPALVDNGAQAGQTKVAGLMKSLAHLFGKGGRQLGRLQNRLEPHWLEKLQKVPRVNKDTILDQVTPFKTDIFSPGGYSYRMQGRGGAAPGMESVLERLQTSLRGGDDVLERLPSIARTFADDVRGGGIWQNTAQAGRDLYKHYGLSLDEAGLKALSAEASLAPRLYRLLQSNRQAAFRAIHATQVSRAAKLQALQRKWDAGAMKRIFALGGGVAGGVAGGRALLQPEG